MSLFLYNQSSDRRTVYIHKAWDHCSIIEEWAVESLKAVIDDGSHASSFVNAERRGQGGKDFLRYENYFIPAFSVHDKYLCTKYPKIGRKSNI
ncbi:hypothetical protein [Parabacteroides chinchillae]|uniref:Uncharacterized protein n=1 Tax=Parabacteroides chinchillae TaxID=871327 RepID=A0A8G2BXU0_9BACT|nr:hypothetical protein [Parabacteroides chinchillae]SEG09365.1 hypothetical protein SAMN05444001_114119 [Parabacteroides chinchillae]